ncbi:MAG: hypothetical protein Q4Q03_01235 [Bowdeniella nasicola]|nr:hypothetical protein [Bowdeniella nasicola]
MVLTPWWSLLATAVGAGALLVLPGTLIAKSWQLPNRLAVACASGITLAILGGYSLLAPAISLRWNLRHVLTVLTLSVVANAIVAKRFAPRRQHRGEGADIRYLLPLGLAVVITTVLTFALGGAHPHLPAQAWDALFHQNAIAEMARSQNADPTTALAALYLGRHVTYPTLWDGLFALFPTGAVTGYNASMITIALVLTCASWAWFRLGSSSVLLAAGGTWLSASLVSVTTLTTLGATAPYAASLVVLLGAASGVYMLRFSPSEIAPVRWPTIIITAIAALGATLTHPSAVFSLLVICAPALLPAAGRTGATWWHRGLGARIGLITAGTCLLLGAAGGVWVAREKFATVFSYQRAGGSAIAALMDFPLDISSLSTHPPAISSLAIVGLGVVVSAGLYLRRAHLRTPLATALLIATIIAFILDILAAGPNWVGRMLAGPWYTQRARLTPLVWMAALGFLSAVLARVATTHPPRFRRRQTAVIAVVLLGLATVPARATLVAHTYDPHQISYGTMLTTAQLESIPKLEAAFPSPTRVLVNPVAGGGYLFALSDRLDPVFKQLGTTGPASLWPLSHPDNYRASQVCQALERAQVTHYLRWVGDEVNNAHYGAKQVPAFASLDALPAVLGQQLSAPTLIAGWQVYRIECPPAVQ